MDDVFTKYILISNGFNYKAVRSISGGGGGCKHGGRRQRGGLQVGGEGGRRGGGCIGGGRGGGSSAAWLAEYLRTCLGGVLLRDETKGGGNTL